MPAILTHYTFTKILTNEESLYSSLVYLGAQGPDVFFFLGYLKKRENAKDIRAFGHYLHSIDIAPIYSFFISYAKKQNENEKEALHAYIRGLMYHYALDRNCHAYIFSRTGWALEDIDDKGYYMRAHVFFEANIDVLIANHYKTTKHNKKCIKTDLNYVSLVSKMYKALNDEIFHFDYLKEDTFILCYKDMYFLQKMFYSPLGFKRLLYYPFRKKVQLWVQTNPRKPYHDEIIHYLNIEKNVWRDLVSGEERTESFFALIESAKEDALKIDQLLELSKTKDITNELSLFVNKLTHDGIRVDEKMTYFDFCYNLIKKIPF